MDIQSELIRLTNSVYGRWQKARLDTARFADVATDALQEFDATRISARDFLKYAAMRRSTVLPGHGGGGVMGLHAAPDFAIFLHAWFDAIAWPHCHCWPGAFQVLEGLTLTRTFQFHERERPAALLALGTVSADPIRFLRPGHVERVTEGPSYAHAVDHRERPTFALSIRGPAISWTGDVFVDSGVVVCFEEASKRTETMRPLLTVGDVPFRDSAIRYLANDCLLEDCALHILRDPAAFSSEEIEYLVATLSERFSPAWVEPIRSAWAESKRNRHFMAIRGRTREHDARTLLGLLFMARKRSELIGALREIKPNQDPEVTLADWTAKLLRALIPEMSWSSERIAATMQPGNGVDPEIEPQIRRLAVFDALFES